jgi:hypothetical protein
MKKILTILAGSTLAMSASALQPLPQGAGFSGYAGLGAAGGEVKSNFLAEVVTIELSDTTIYNLDSPKGTDIIVPQFEFNLGYTFNNEKTRAYLGSAVDNPLEFSSNTVLALRHDFDASVGNVEVAGIIPSVSQVKVWENPYLTNQGRKDTDISTSGVRLIWDKILGSQFELKGSYRKIDIQRERSGENLGLSVQEQQLLDREGDHYDLELGYMINLGNGEHRIRPHVKYLKHDLDGKAMYQDGYGLGVRYTYDAGNFQWLNRVGFADLKGDDINPIFLKRNDSKTYLLASEVQYPDPFGWDKWTAKAGIQWGDEDADIDFNEGSVLMVSARMTRSF